jgi:hypothetical protein
MCRWTLERERERDGQTDRQSTVEYAALKRIADTQKLTLTEDLYNQILSHTEAQCAPFFLFFLDILVFLENSNGIEVISPLEKALYIMSDKQF